MYPLVQRFRKVMLTKKKFIPKTRPVTFLWRHSKTTFKRKWVKYIIGTILIKWSQCPHHSMITKHFGISRLLRIWKIWMNANIWNIGSLVAVIDNQIGNNMDKNQQNLTKFVQFSCLKIQLFIILWWIGEMTWNSAWVLNKYLSLRKKKFVI